jgi:hypothetical protein
MVDNKQSAAWSRLVLKEAAARIDAAVKFRAKAEMLGQENVALAAAREA